MRPHKAGRRKKTVEALDWRELASGPALRGLAEVLSTPAETSKERLIQRTEVAPAIDTPTVDVTPTVPDTPTVDDTPTVTVTPTVGATELQSKPRRQKPMVSVTSTVGVTPSVVFKPTVGVPPTVPTPAAWADAEGNLYEPKRVLRVSIAQQSMALGEERVYQSLWHARDSDGFINEGRKSRVFTLGYDRIARLVRLNEKSVRVLLPKLIAKKIMEIVAAETCATRTGRTYRIFSYEEILERQRRAGLLHVVKIGRAVEFVQPISPTVGVSPTVVHSPTHTVGLPPADTVVQTPTATVGHTPTPLVTNIDTSSSQSTSSIRQALSDYGPADDEAAVRLENSCRKNAADATTEEILHFIRLKGASTKGGRVSNPIAFLLVYVPKCFVGDTLAQYRIECRERREADAAREHELAEWQAAELDRQRQILNDPNADEDDKRWARKFLA